MAKKVNDVKWRELIEKFSSYEGTLDIFCKENSINRSQFYYYRKRFGNDIKNNLHSNSWLSPIFAKESKFQHI